MTKRLSLMRLFAFIFLLESARSQACDRSSTYDYRTFNCQDGIFYNAMLTPSAILDNAHVGQVYSLTATGEILFGTGTSKSTRLLRIPLAKAGQLNQFQTISVDVTFSHKNPTSPTTDMDLAVFLSDGVSAIGFRSHDKLNFRDHCPLCACEGVSGHKMSALSCNNINKGITSNPATVHTLHFRIDPQRPATAAGYSNVMSVYHQYSKKLHLERGLYLELYRNDPGETYILSFIRAQAYAECLT